MQPWSSTLLPESVWKDTLNQDGSVRGDVHVAELNRLNTRTGWPDRMPLTVRPLRPSRRQLANLTAFEKKTGWRYSIAASNVRHLWGIAGSHQAQFLDVLHRSHATVEDGVRANKALGLNNLRSQSWDVNRGWMLAANRAADLDAWMSKGRRLVSPAL
nr:hypothetical protein [Streptomyces sp. TLI_235]